MFMFTREKRLLQKHDLELKNEIYISLFTLGSILLNMVKNPNWPQTNQMAILQAWSRIYIWDHHEQIQLAVRAGLEFWACGLLVQRSNRSATLPPLYCLINFLTF